MRGIFVCTIKLLQKYIVKKIFLCYNIKLSGGVAHLGERDIRIVEVTGSSPAVSTIQKSLEAMRFWGFFLLKKTNSRRRSSAVCSTILQKYGGNKILPYRSLARNKPDSAILYIHGQNPAYRVFVRNF